MSAQLQTVAYGKGGGVSETFQKARRVQGGVDVVVDRLKLAIVAADLLVLHEINPQQILSAGGYGIRPARQLLFFHPRFMTRLLGASSAALLEAPLKFAVMDLPDAATEIRWMDPTISFGRYRLPALAALGIELAALCERIVREAGFEQTN